MPKRVAKQHPQTAVEKARKDLAKAEAAHREAFRVACAKLFTEFKLALEADGDLSAHLKIVTFDGEFAVSELPK